MKTISCLRRLLALACLFGAATGAQAGPPRLSIIDVGQATGLSELQLADINNRGDLLLRREADGRAFIWNPTNGLVVVDIPGTALFPFAMNDAREIVGQFASASAFDGFRWDSTRGFRQSRHDGFESAVPTAINSQGEVAGSGKTPEGRYHMVVGGPGRALHRVRNDEKGQSQASAINDAGQLGAILTVRDGCCLAAGMVDRDGSVTLLGTLAAPGEKDYSRVMAVSAMGDAVGSSGNRNYRGHAFFWSAASSMRDIHPLPANRGWSESTDINRWGQVVGIAVHGDKDFAFSWDKENGSTDLNARLDPADPLYTVTQVVGYGWPYTNDQGQIAAAALVRGVRTVVLLSPGNP